MPAIEIQDQFRRASAFSLKRHHHSSSIVDGAADLDAFQAHVFDCFQHLFSLSQDLLSLSWLHDLLNCFLCLHNQFKILVVSTPKAQLNKPIVGRLLFDYLESNVKALDVCNAIRDEIEQMRQWQKLLEIVLCALDRDQTLGEGQFWQAKKVLIDLAIAMVVSKLMLVLLSI